MTTTLIMVMIILTKLMMIMATMMMVMIMVIRLMMLYVQCSLGAVWHRSGREFLIASCICDGCLLPSFPEALLFPCLVVEIGCMCTALVPIKGLAAGILFMHNTVI